MALVFFICQSVALAQERERELAQRDSLIRVLTETRDQALVTLQRHGLAIPTQFPSKEKQMAINAHGTADQRDLPAEEKIKALEVQNADLRAVIRQMRRDMEDLNNQLAGRPPSVLVQGRDCLLYTSPSPRDGLLSRMPSSA